MSERNKILQWPLSKEELENIFYQMLGAQLEREDKKREQLKSKLSKVSGTPKPIPPSLARKP